MIIEMRLCIVNLFCRRRRGSRWATEWASILTGKLINSLTRSDHTTSDHTRPDRTRSDHSFLRRVRFECFSSNDYQPFIFLVQAMPPVPILRAGPSPLLPSWFILATLTTLTTLTTYLFSFPKHNIHHDINSGGRLQRCNRNLPRWRTCSVLSGSC